MKKIICLIITFLLFTCLIFSGCNNAFYLEKNVVELRSNLYCGKSENTDISCAYGYKTENNKIEYSFTFKLNKDVDTSVLRNITLELEGKTYTGDFYDSPLTGSPICNIKVDSITVNEFSITYCENSNSEKIAFTSIVPTNTISSTSALEYLNKNSPTLISYYTKDNVFVASITERIIVKNEKSFWYIGLKYDKDEKALLIDGKTGEVLAIRDIV